MLSEFSLRNLCKKLNNLSQQCENATGSRIVSERDALQPEQSRNDYQIVTFRPGFSPIPMLTYWEILPHYNSFCNLIN